MTHPRVLSDTYQRLNEYFTSILIYHCGIDTGFFTEYTRMIDAMLYCLEHKLQFRLYSDHANFAYTSQGGWTDYFLPFCPEVHENFHQRFNRYSMPPWKVILRGKHKEKKAGLIFWKLKATVTHGLGRCLAWTIYKRKVRLTHHVRPFPPSHEFNIPELGIHGDYLHAFNILSDMVWQLNDEMKRESSELCRELSMPSEYAGCQIRGGDKITETSLIPPSRYIDMLRKENAPKDVFVLTDDYRLFGSLKSQAPDMQWHTLCMPEETGYVNQAFSHVRNTQKREQMARFLTSVELLSHS
ncbi:MAG: hypothetical protein LUC45_05280 [Paraprevotella sp.]|nr:hypothetical protein [Paraprevotella sp.]